MNNFNSKDFYELTLDLTKELCKIPAPSGLEEKRAEFILSYLKNIGYENAYIDSGKNVIWKIDGKTSDYSLFMAHTDTVFPDLEPFNIVEDDDFLRCPGVTDDTVCVAMLLAYSKYLKDIDYKPTKSILFSANSCEEGLGNLKGARQLFKDFNNISDMFTLDGGYKHLCNKSVGSHRYKVIVKTEGGHSFGNFGNNNAIAILSEITCKIYEIKVPKINDSKTTYNVGTISGGTSVNTIAQSAEMLCEYRSDNLKCFNEMKENFTNIFDNAKQLHPTINIDIELVGDRPCMGDVDKEKMDQLTNLVKKIQEKHTKLTVKIESGSTDCNIPHSLSIPAICVGVYEGGGIHTREEYLVKKSIIPGLDIVNELIYSITK